MISTDAELQKVLSPRKSKTVISHCRLLHRFQQFLIIALRLNNPEGRLWNEPELHSGSPT
eukprot:576347-Heterocapsa_arctica.AAC.1